MSPALFLTLRRLRAPIILLIVVFSVGIVGLVLIPGIDEQGREWHLTIFQALYFMTYTATTIGFGELPRAFSHAQRVWVSLVIFGSVVGWAYLVAALLSLGRDRAFQSALILGRFRRTVRGLREPFHIICGFGETGSLVGRALDRFGSRFTVVEIQAERVQALELTDLVQEAPGLAADARLPDNLLSAGLTSPCCRGVLALTDDDRANLAVAMSVRMLNPRIPVLARAMDQSTAANMASFGTDHIINPFSTFGGYLALAVASPGGYRLLSWLTGLPGTTLKRETAPPRGHWVVCGYGRFGREVVKAFRGLGLDITIIEPKGTRAEGLHTVAGRGTEADTLMEAGVAESVGIVAGTDDDVNNLSIAVTARELNPKLFTVVRQNLQANAALFGRFAADITMVSSEVIANECLARMNTPLLSDFLDLIRSRGDAWADAVIEKMQATIGTESPETWTVQITAADAPALDLAIRSGAAQIRLNDLCRDPADRMRRLQAIPLYLIGRGRSIVMPEEDLVIKTGDEVLFAGCRRAARAQRSILRNLNTLRYTVDGVDLPGGWIWQWLSRRRS